MRILSAVALAALVVTGCARAPDPEPAPAPQRPVPRPIPRPVPPPPPTSSDWRDWPIASGTWTYRADNRGSIALFGTGGADADFTVRCDKAANAIYLSRAGDARGAGFTIRTTTLTRTLATQPTGATPSYVAAMLSPDDRLLDAIGFSRGRFLVEAPPLTPLAIPAWSEVLRVIEDCRG